MSEELLQTIPQQIGKFTYYRLGATTLDQLKKAGIIPNRSYAKLRLKKPDGLVVYHGAIKAVVEYKQPKELSSKADIAKAVAQEIDVAKRLCKILVVTDGSKSFWVNALNGERVTDAKGEEVRVVFHPFPVTDINKIEFLLSEMDASLTSSNSAVRSAKLIDPTPLANRLWQTIWVATGKSPVKCLYNVVELFIFKFLSDLRVLPEDLAFENIRRKTLDNAADALEFYARNTRRRIYKLFPAGEDGTTIINGTIFVTERGEPNLSQSILFQRSLDHLAKYAEEFGSLTKIDKQFKTKLYESFLQQEVEALGQYFTPRKVVQSVIRMSRVNEPSFQFSGKRICDPFCGVGGFPLELLNLNESMMNAFAPDNAGKIKPSFTLHGFDKGFERDDERTIILAKANMLIYMAELLFASPQCSAEFAGAFNRTFSLFKDNLGTFGYIIKDEADKYDFIFSNPPYVTSGSGIIKEEIQRTPHTQNEYPINALGLEGLSMEWIVKSLKRGGKAFVIIPDGILARVGEAKLRRYLLRECYLDAIVALPVRTFFANSERTYILALTKKQSPDDTQTDPVFTYLVSNIGERLTSVKRDEISDDDLPEMETLFKLFSAAKGAQTAEILEARTARCKIQGIERFIDGPHWVIDRWWSRDERTPLEASKQTGGADGRGVGELIAGLSIAVVEYDTFAAAHAPDIAAMRSIQLGHTDLFALSIGKRVLKRDVTDDATKIPVYSANVVDPMGYLDDATAKASPHPAALWGIDGNFDFNLLPAGSVFRITDHCGMIQILDDTVVPEYLMYALDRRRTEESFSRSFRASLANMRSFVIDIPVKPDGLFDTDAQRELATRFSGLQERRAALKKAKSDLDAMLGPYLQQRP